LDWFFWYWLFGLVVSLSLDETAWMMAQNVTTHFIIDEDG